MIRDRILTRWLGIQRGEEGIAALLFFYLYGIITCYLMVKTARDGLFLGEIGAKGLPIVFIATAVATALFLGVYQRLLRYFSLPRITLLSLGFFISNLLLFWWLSQFEFKWLYWVIYIWGSLFGVIGAMQVWMLANHLLTTRQAKRLFGMLGSGGLLGGITGSFLAAYLSKDYGTEFLLLVVAFLLAGTMVLVYSVTRKQRAQPAPTSEPVSPQKEKSPRPGVIQSMRWITASRYLMLITATVALGRVATTVVEYQFKATIGEELITTDNITAFIGNFTGVMGIVAFAFQFLLTRRILEKLGILTALLMLPIGYLLGSASFFFLPVLSAATGIKGAGMLLKHSISRSSLEMLYLPLSGQMKYAAKSFIDTAVWRVSDGIGGAILFLFATTLGWSASQLIWVNLPLLLAWVAVSFLVRSGYVGTLRSSIRRRVLAPERAHVQWQETSTVLELRHSLGSEDEAEIFHTLEVVEWAELKDLAKQVHALTEHPSARIRARAITLLTQWETPEAASAAEALLDDEDLEVRTAAAYGFALLGTDPAQTNLRTLLEHPLPGIRTAAVTCLMQTADRDRYLPECRKILEDIIDREDSESVPARRDVARALRHPAVRELGQALLPRLLEDADYRVRRTAIHTMSRYANPEWIPLLIVQLGIRPIQTAVLDALAAYGPAAVSELTPWLVDRAWPAEVRKRVAKLFGRLDTRKALPPLLEAIEDPQPDVRHAVMKSLYRLHRTHPDWELPQPALRAALRLEAAGAYLYLAGLQRVRFPDHSFEDTAFLKWALEDRFEKTLERIFSLLGMLHPLKSVQTAFMVLRDSGVVSQANAVEYLDQILHGRTRAMVFPLIVPEMDLQTKLRHGEQAFPPLKEFGKNPWAELFRVPDVLLRVCLLSSLGSQMDSIPTEQISSSARVGHPMVRQAARQVLSGKTPPEASAETEAAAAETATNRAPLTEVEKLKALQWTDVFSHADPDALVHLAQRAREQHFRKGETSLPGKGPPRHGLLLGRGRRGVFSERKDRIPSRRTLPSFRVPLPARS